MGIGDKIAEIAQMYGLGETIKKKLIELITLKGRVESTGPLSDFLSAIIEFKDDASNHISNTLYITPILILYFLEFPNQIKEENLSGYYALSHDIDTDDVLRIINIFQIFRDEQGNQNTINFNAAEALVRYHSLPLNVKTYLTEVINDLLTNSEHYKQLLQSDPDLFKIMLGAKQPRLLWGALKYLEKLSKEDIAKLVTWSTHDDFKTDIDNIIASSNPQMAFKQMQENCIKNLFKGDGYINARNISPNVYAATKTDDSSQHMIQKQQYQNTASEEEAHMLASLRNHYIIRSAPAIFTSKTMGTCSVLPYYELGNLSSFPQNHDFNLETDKLDVYFKLCYGVVSAFAYLDKKNILHLNLTAENIFVTSQYQVKVSGFDRAIKVKNTNSITLINSENGEYASSTPESKVAIRNNTQVPVSAATDIFFLAGFLSHLIDKADIEPHSEFDLIINRCFSKRHFVYDDSWKINDTVSCLRPSAETIKDKLIAMGSQILCNKQLVLTRQSVQQDRINVWRPAYLFYWIRKGSIALVMSMLAADSDLVKNVGTQDGLTAVHCAIKHMQFAILKLLLDNGFSPTAVDKAGRSPRLYAAMQNSAEAIRIIQSKISKADSPASSNTSTKSPLKAFYKSRLPHQRKTGALLYMSIPAHSELHEPIQSDNKINRAKST